METLKSEYPNLPGRLRGLEDLAANLWWSWHPAARMVFKMLNREVWKQSVHNPDKMLKELPAETLASAAEEPDYLRHYDLVLSQFRKYMSQRECHLLRDVCSPDGPLIAYFSAEYGLHHSLPFYAGGLGFLAGDFLKECSDLSVPLVAVGFMYPEGYVRQSIREDGWQESMDQILDRDAASIFRVLNKDGSQLVVQVPLFEPPLYVTVWKVAVGRVDLFLLDTDIESNSPWNRAISARLYTGDLELRLRQEIVLGIGGAEVLEKMGIKPIVVHLNEGHAALALLEQLRDLVRSGMSYSRAVEMVRNTTIFTTHTPVEAGHDIFPFHLMEKYFHSYWPSLGLDRDSFLALGIHPEAPHAGFNMTAFALRMSGFRNGVSRRHGEVARRTWKALWPEAASEQIPIDHVTNGVHVPSWIEPKMELLFNRYFGPGWLENHDNPLVWALVDEIPDEALWKTHYWLKIKLINAIRERARLRWLRDGAGSASVLSAGPFLDPGILTIGFARRFATYKRADLILADRERLRRLLNDRWRPIQIIFAGKAHPADDPAKVVLQNIVRAARDPELGGRIAFVEDYGEQMAQYLVHGVDVWLSNPLPPLEASGTSGMKAALNGVPSLSILDGWWIEGYNGRNGWAFGGEEGDGDRRQRDADAVYRLLEEEVIPLYYRVSENGTPHAWARLMKETIKSCAAQFSARRMVGEYVGKYYVEALRQVAKKT